MDTFSRVSVLVLALHWHKSDHRLQPDQNCALRSCVTEERKKPMKHPVIVLLMSGIKAKINSSQRSSNIQSE